MNHDHADDALSAYLDGEISPVEKAEVEAHLLSCARCRETLEDLKATKTMVRELQRLEAPVTLWKQIETEIGREKVPVSGTSQGSVVPFRRRVSRIAAAAAAIAVFFFTSVTLVGYFAGEPNTPDENAYMASQAYHSMRLPLSDHASWSYASGEAAYAFSNSEE